MNPLILFKGFLIGLSLSAPLGPIALVCIRRSLTQGFWYGFFSGLGAATADILYGSIAICGLTIVSSIILSYNLLLRVIAGFFLCYLGIHILLSKTSQKNVIGWAHGILASYISALFLTLSNPLTFLAFALAFAVFDINPYTITITEAVALITGVFLGATTWWALISFIAHSLRTKVTMDIVQKINAICGAIILIFGILTLLSLLNGIGLIKNYNYKSS